ncbi:MAG: ferrous iron transport protein B, partial [Duncaniella sp.]|nr:ferrous iron transport protein B [Duncaniella sp.]
LVRVPPLYRNPPLTSTLLTMGGKGEPYHKKLGGIIPVASIIVWALNYYQTHDEDSTAITADGISVVDDSEIDFDNDSYLEMMGKAINPVMEPIGFHWRASVAALAGVPAKEIVVSTLGVLYTGDEEASEQTLSSRLTAPNPATGKPDFTAAAALSFMVFILLYCPCIATVTAIVKETGNPRYGLFSVLYNTLVAWIFAFIVYQVALLL